MRDFKKRRDPGYEIFNFFALCIGLLFVLGIAGASIQAARGMYTKFVVASKGDDAAQGDLAELKRQHARITAAVADLSSGRGEEGQVRERFGVARPGEGAIQIVRSGTSTPGEQNTIQPNIFMKLFRAIFIW